MLDERCLIYLLLKVTSQIKWHFLDREDPTFKRFIEILNQITKEDQESEEDKTRSYWEKALIDSWERLIDRDEERNNDFFVVKENLLTEIEETLALIETPENQKQGEEVKKDVVVPEEKKQGVLKTELQNLKKEYQDIEYVQPLSSILRGLPEPISKLNSSKATLKRVAYWEKNIVPKIIEFVRTTYKPWEMRYAFEQLRHFIRIGNYAKVMEDTMTMCENKIPHGCVIPEEHFDWTSRQVDECIVDTWALAKFKP